MLFPAGIKLIVGPMLGIDCAAIGYIQVGDLYTHTSRKVTVKVSFVLGLITYTLPL